MRYFENLVNAVKTGNAARRLASRLLAENPSAVKILVALVPLDEYGRKVKTRRQVKS